MKSSKFYLFMFLTPLLVFGFQNCGGEAFRSLESSSSLSFCKAQPVLKSSFDGQKVQLPESWFLGFQKASSQSYDLSIVVDVSCYKEQSSLSFLGQDIILDEVQITFQKAAIPLTLSYLPQVDDLKDELDAQPCILGVSDNPIVKKSALLATDPKASEQKHLDHLGYDESRELVQAITQKVIVAIVDSGVEYTHDDLSSRMWQNASGHHGRNFVAGTNDPLDDDGHGTHVAGIVAAKENNGIAVAGLTGDFVEIMAVKVLDSSGSGTTQNVHDGIQYAIANGAHIINLSVEYPGSSPLMETAIRDAVNAGIIVTMSTGNQSQQITADNLFAPAYVGPSVDGAISVASIDATTNGLSFFSNHSPHYAEISAPGAEISGMSNTGILSTYIRDGFTRYTGTSQSAPMVSAAAAILIGYVKSKGMTYTPNAIETYLKDAGSSKSQNLSAYVNDGNILNLRLLTKNLKDYFAKLESNEEDPDNFVGGGPSSSCYIR